MKRMRIFVAALAVGLVGYVTLVAYSLTMMSTSHLVICANGEPVGYIPSNICRRYLLDQRLGAAAVTEIEAVGGVDFLLNTSKGGGHHIADAFLAEGLDIEAPAGGQGGATPLQAAVLYGEPQRIEYLLARGADVAATSDRLPLPPLELARKLSADGRLKQPAVLELLEAAVARQGR